MTTITVNINDYDDACKLVETLRMVKGVTHVSMDSDGIVPAGRIPGLPYTHEERLAAIDRAEQEHAEGCFVDSGMLRKRHPRV